MTDTRWVHQSSVTFGRTIWIWVEERFQKKAKADSIKKIGEDFGLQAGVAENYYDFQTSQKRADLEKEFAGKTFIGTIKKNKKGEYKAVQIR